MSADVDPLVSIRGLTVRYNGPVTAVDGVSFDIGRGEWLGLVGESGCGKSSLARAIVRLERPAAGAVSVDGVDVASAGGRELTGLRRAMQLIFQDPYSSLDPRMKVGAIIAEPLVIHGLHGGRRRQRVAELMELVGLHPEMANRFPHEFSGGQRQRIGIARALAVEPRFLVCDEPISALDVSIQAQILNLLVDLQQQLGLTYLFIGHNVPAVAMFSDRIAVMYLGKFVEIGPSAAIQTRTAHPYTRALLDAVPVPDPAAERARVRHTAVGEPATAVVGGCPFRPRCWLYRKLGEPALCRTSEPDLLPVDTPWHLSRCHFGETTRG
jgi:peptide/nickel transport system ATP-binding protein